MRSGQGTTQKLPWLGPKFARLLTNSSANYDSGGFVMGRKAVSLLSKPREIELSRSARHARLFELHRQILDMPEQVQERALRSADPSKEQEVSFQMAASSSFGARPAR